MQLSLAVSHAAQALLLRGMPSAGAQGVARAGAVTRAVASSATAAPVRACKLVSAGIPVAPPAPLAPAQNAAAAAASAAHAAGIG